MRLIVSHVRLLAISLFSKHRVLASMYCFVSRKFDIENVAVLAGIKQYNYRLKNSSGEVTSVFLRRNIHRIEKGLIMQQRRDLFAEDYIIETVDAYKRILDEGVLDIGERKWVEDILTKYFSQIKETVRTRTAKMLFESLVKILPERSRYIPYEHNEILMGGVSYDQLKQLAVQRRSVRWYRREPVPLALVEKAVSLASLAPSACNRQPYCFYITDDKNKSAAIAKCAAGTKGWADNIPCMVVVVGDLSSYADESDRHLIHIDASLAVMQLMLALETLGLSSCAINWPESLTAEKNIRELVSLQDYERPVMLLSVGFAKENGMIAYSQKKSNAVLIKKI